jgi:hypothetical protein
MLDAENWLCYLLTVMPIEPYNTAVENIGQNLDGLRILFTPYKDQLAELSVLSKPFRARWRRSI